MRLKNLKHKDEIMTNNPYLIYNPSDYKGKYQSLFNNTNPIELEIGCGKGDFIINKALTNPNINYIGLEKYDSVIARALKKVDIDIPNLRFIREDALNIDNVFDHEISVLYLNFSDPWPKLRHHDRRLTSRIFLEKYDSIFKSKNIIIQKTDNTDLYKYSLQSFKDYGYKIKETSEDLYNSKYIVGNIPTEYETKFHNDGLSIYYVKTEK